MDFKEFSRKAKEGSISIGVDPADARKLFTETDAKSTYVKFGETFSATRLFAQFLFVSSYLVVFFSVVISVYIFHWFSLVAIPLIVVVDIYLIGKASVGNHSLTFPVILLIISVVVVLFSKNQTQLFNIWIISLPVPFLFSTLMYSFVSNSLRAILIKNEKVYNMFSSHNAIIIKQ